MAVSPDAADSIEEQLTRQFLAWEVRGRGWQVWDVPVEIEPPFRPFFGHYVSRSAHGPADDGRKPTLLSSLADRLKSAWGRNQASVRTQDESIEEPEPRPFRESPLCEIHIALPAGTKIGKDAAEQFVLSLGS